MMNMQGEMGESSQNASLRPVVAAMSRELAHLADGTPAQIKAGMGQLRASWCQVVALLALGPAPEMRECPVCKHGGMRAATRCGFCWTALPAVAHGWNEQPSEDSSGGG